MFSIYGNFIIFHNCNEFIFQIYATKLCVVLFHNQQNTVTRSLMYLHTELPFTVRLGITYNFGVHRHYERSAKRGAKFFLNPRRAGAPKLPWSAGGCRAGPLERQCCPGQ